MKRESHAEIEALREELIAAMKTLRAIPGSSRDMPSQLRSQWPEFNQGGGLASSSKHQKIQIKATPEQISQMQYWLNLTFGLDEECRRIVLARACRIPWRKLEELDGRSHTTLRKIERKGLEVLMATKVGGSPHGHPSQP